MSADIRLDSFKHQLKNICRSNRFWVTITGNQGGATWLEQPFSFIVKSFSIPDLMIGEINVPYMGRVAKLGGDITVSDINMVVHLQEDMKIRDYFETWMNAIANMLTNERGVPEEYQASITVEQLDSVGSTIKSWRLKSAWPKQLNTIEVSHDNVDTAMDMNVDFAIEDWESF
jgi:hypothetical protein